MKNIVLAALLGLYSIEPVAARNADDDLLAQFSDSDDGEIDHYYNLMQSEIQKDEA